MIVTSDLELIKENEQCYTMLRLPEMADDQYDKIKIAMEIAGGNWSELYKAFIFLEPRQVVKDRLEEMHDIEHIDIPEYKKFQIETQFYPTPTELAHKMARMANITKEDTVLEPSAGKGALLDQIVKYSANVTAIEYNKENADYLRILGYEVIHDSFENAIQNGLGTFDKVIMNPPFSHGRDIKHTILAYNHLKVGGKLVGLISDNSLYYKSGLCETLRKFLTDTHADIEHIPMGMFKESGTNVAVALLNITKTSEISYSI